MVPFPQQTLDTLVKRLTERELVGGAGGGARLADVSVEAGDAGCVGQTTTGSAFRPAPLASAVFNTPSGSPASTSSDYFVPRLSR